MKIKINFVHFINNLKFVASFASKSYARPVLTQITLASEDKGILVMRATNSTILVEHRASLEVIEGGNAQIDPIPLIKMLSIYKDKNSRYEDLEVEFTGEKIIVKGRKFEFSLTSKAVAVYPEVIKIFDDRKFGGTELILAPDTLATVCTALQKFGFRVMKFHINERSTQPHIITAKDIYRHETKIVIAPVRDY